MGRREAGIPYNFDASEHLALEAFLPSQFAAMRAPSHWSGERKLLFAILMDALRCLASWTPASVPTRPGQMTKAEYNYREALRWIRSDDERPFTFQFICSAFELDPERVRKKIAAGVKPHRRSSVWCGSSKRRAPVNGTRSYALYQPV